MVDIGLNLEKNLARINENTKIVKEDAMNKMDIALILIAIISVLFL